MSLGQDTADRAPNLLASYPPDRSHGPDCLLYTPEQRPRDLLRNPHRGDSGEPQQRRRRTVPGDRCLKVREIPGQVVEQYTAAATTCGTSTSPRPPNRTTQP